MGAGHTSGLFQDENGDWYYTFWAIQGAYVLYVPETFETSDGSTYNSMDSLDNFNLMLETVYGEYDVGGNYNSSVYVEGDFTKSLEYARDTAQGWLSREIDDHSSIAKKCWNLDYSLTLNNCLHHTVASFSKGVLRDGTNAADFIRGNYSWTFFPIDGHDALANIFGGQKTGDSVYKRAKSSLKAGIDMLKKQDVINYIFLLKAR